MRLPHRHSRADTFGGGTLASAGLFALAFVVSLGATVLAVASSWVVRSADIIRPRLAGDATVAVWGRGLESADAAAARTAEILSERPGTRAVPLQPDTTDAWVGALIRGRGPEGDAPRLVAVDMKSPGASLPQSVEQLKTAGITAAADNHRGSKGRLEKRIILAGCLDAGAIVLLCGVVSCRRRLPGGPRSLAIANASTS